MLLVGDWKGILMHWIYADLNSLCKSHKGLKFLLVDDPKQHEHVMFKINTHYTKYTN